MRRFECGAIVFDLDGVLVDARAIGEQQWRRWGRARTEVAATAGSGSDGLESEPSTIRGADRLLASLPLGSWGVATSSRRAAAGDRLRRAGLPVPPVLVCAGDVLRGKPSPDAYLRAARELDVEPLPVPRGGGFSRRDRGRPHSRNARHRIGDHPPSRPAPGRRLHPGPLRRTPGPYRPRSPGTPAARDSGRGSLAQLHAVPARWAKSLQKSSVSLRAVASMNRLPRFASMPLTVHVAAQVSQCGCSPAHPA